MTVTIAAALAGCGQSGEMAESSEDLRTFDVSEGPAPADAPPPPPAPPGARQDSVASEPPPQAGQLPVSQPRIAYTYGYTFRLSADRIAEVQERHVEMCRALGDARCRVVSLERSASSGEFATASTRLQVAAAIAPQFGARLVAAATENGADTVGKAIAGEDLSRQMVDTEARIRTREALIRRLTELLETRSGNIQQAVEAERAINQAQEELEAARGWLAEMRTRVAMSTVNVDYQSGAPVAGGVGNPLREATGEVGSIFARSLALLIVLVGAVLPWALIGLLIFLAIRTARRRGWLGGGAEREEAGSAPGAEEQRPL